MSRRSVGILAAAGALAASVAISGPASAEVAHRTCPKGAFCAYSGDWETGRVLLATQGNWSGTIYNVQSTFNNGYRDPGADHVQLGYEASGISYSICIHYAPGGGQYEHHWNNITVKSVRWRGEC
ncbi:hypothetical protein OG458_00405 [Streptomyces sp. NBC_01281]|uniref:hypothetical protein n=1 Tax=Streptomyces sp. NBC_01281 TaxID=2903811 RepID=UPI002E0FD05E|nr:hypothetical protein OG458_00405 [Streptomyces sp. NBC_01281]